MVDVLSLCVQGSTSAFAEEDVHLIDHRFVLISRKTPPEFSCQLAIDAVIRFLTKVDPRKLDSEA